MSEIKETDEMFICRKFQGSEAGIGIVMDIKKRIFQLTNSLKNVRYISCQEGIS
jgi:hypothetical protein